jgi:hypothetical protein
VKNGGGGELGFRRLGLGVLRGGWGLDRGPRGGAVAYKGRVNFLGVRTKHGRRARGGRSDSAGESERDTARGRG